MAKTSASALLSKAAKLEKIGKYRKSAEIYASILKAGNTSVAARDGLIRAAGKVNPIRTDENQFQTQLNAILKMLKNGDEAEAEVTSARLLKTRPTNVVLLNMNGVANLGLGRSVKAIEALRLAVALKPNFADAYQNLGLSLFQNDQPKQALNAFQTAVRHKPTFAEAYNNIGLIHQSFGELDEAIEAHQIAVQLNPNFADARQNLSVALRGAVRFDEALKELEILRSVNPNDAGIHFQIGGVLKKQERELEAIDSFQRCIECNPGFMDAYFSLGSSLKSVGRLKDAEICYRTALRNEPKSGRAFRNLGTVTKLNSSSSEVAEMLSLLEEQDVTDDNASQLHFALANSFDQSGDLPSSFSHLKKGNSLRRQLLKYDFGDDLELFDKIIRSSDAISKFEFEPNPSNGSVTPIFILGMPRSGTSLTEQIVSAHPEVQGAGELKYASNYGKGITTGEVELTSPALAEFRDSYLSSLSRLSKGMPFVTDKMPHNFLLVGLIAKAIPEAKIVHISRDPGAICWSNYSIRFGAKGLGYAYNLSDVVEYYHLYENLIAHWNKTIPGKMISLNYESLTQDQNLETRKLIERLALDWDDACLAPEKNTRAVATASKLQVQKGVYTGSSEKWRKYQPFLNGAFDTLYK